MSDQTRVIYETAQRHGDRYLLPRRRRRAIGERTALDVEYDACQALVSGGYARWITSHKAPGIELTGKPLTLTTAAPQEHPDPG